MIYAYILDVKKVLYIINMSKKGGFYTPIQKQDILMVRSIASKTSTKVVRWSVGGRMMFEYRTLF